MKEMKSPKFYHRLFVSESVSILLCIYIYYMYCVPLGYGYSPLVLIPGSVLVFTLLQSAVFWFFCKSNANNGTSQHNPVVLTIYYHLKKIMPFLFALFPLYFLWCLVFNQNEYFFNLSLSGWVIWFLSIHTYWSLYYFPLQFGNFKSKTPSDLALELKRRSAS